MTVRVKRINVLQYALVYAMLSVVAGVVVALFMFPMMAFMASMPAANEMHVPWLGMGVAPVILMPIFYGVFGFIAGLIVAAIYNVVAGWTGGIEMTLETITTP